MDPDVMQGFHLLDKVLDAIQGLLLAQHDQIETLEARVQELTDRVTDLEGRTR